MARQLVTRVWCDICLNEGLLEQTIKPRSERDIPAYTEAEETPPITVGNRKPRVLALCKHHNEEWETFRLMLEEYGQVVDTPPPRRGRAAPRQDTGSPPDEGEGPPMSVTRAECDVCGKVYEWPRNARPSQALGMHKRKAHGIRGGGRKPKAAKGDT